MSIYISIYPIRPLGLWAACGGSALPRSAAPPWRPPRRPPLGPRRAASARPRGPGAAPQSSRFSSIDVGIGIYDYIWIIGIYILYVNIYVYIWSYMYRYRWYRYILYVYVKRG